ncbi:MAG: lysophospholipase [Lachnospiraceae bacterium]|nr:lysophospholipase [Lachnospiraceae bacterium]
MRREEFFYDSRDNMTKIHAVKWIPEGNPICVLQIVHGMAEYALRYDDVARYLAQKGVLVVASDHLGHGLSKREEAPYGYFCKRDAATVVVRDVHRLKKIVQEENLGVPYFILGHSMGSFVTRNYLFRYGKGIDGAMIMGTGNQPGYLPRAAKMLASILTIFKGAEHVSPLIDKLSFGDYNKQIENPVTNVDWLSRDKHQVDRYIEDPLCGFVFTLNGFHTLFDLIIKAEKKSNIEKIPKDLPILFLAGTADPVGEYGKGVRLAYENMKAAGIKDIDIKLYDGGRHEILNEIDKEIIYADVYKFLKTHIQNS